MVFLEPVYKVIGHIELDSTGRVIVKRLQSLIFITFKYQDLFQILLRNVLMMPSKSIAQISKHDIKEKYRHIRVGILQTS